MADEWRRTAAALADPVRRQVYASLVLDVPTDVAPKKRDKALAALVAAGLVEQRGEQHTVIDNAFTELLAAAPIATRTGVDRYIRDGRIVQIPVRPNDRLEVLTWVRDRALPDGTPLSEHELGERLAEVTTDAAALRRHLVGAGLAIRDADGRRYWRAPEVAG